MAYPSVNDVRIFEFIDDVRKNVINNAIVPFRDFADIESYLRKQWAGMMFSFLTGISEEARVYDTLSELTKMSEKIELLSKQILSSVGSAKAKLTIKLFEAMMKYDSFRDLTYFGLRPTPVDVIQANNFVELGKKYGVEIGNFEDDEDNSGFVKSSSGKMSTLALDMAMDNFQSMKKELSSIILENGLMLEEFLQE